MTLMMTVVAYATTATTANITNTSIAIRYCWVVDRLRQYIDCVTISGKGKGKGMVLYSAVSSPLDRSKRFTLSSPGRPVHSNTNSASLGSILAMQQLRNDYTLTCPPLSIARYSFIQLSRLRRREVNENAQTSKR